MSADAPITVARTELGPEFNQFTLGTGDVLEAAVELARKPATDLATRGETAMLFRLGPGVHRVDVRLEVWPGRPGDTPADCAGSLEDTITAVDARLHLVSTTPSPRDVSVPLPTEGRLTVQVFVLDRHRRHDADFGIEVSVSRWLIRVW